MADRAGRDVQLAPGFDGFGFAGERILPAVAFIFFLGMLGPGE
jgi:hypothetical protein